jgi:hypothetical protein
MTATTGGDGRSGEWVYLYLVFHRHDVVRHLAVVNIIASSIIFRPRNAPSDIVVMMKRRLFINRHWMQRIGFTYHLDGIVTIIRSLPLWFILL